MTTPLLSVIDLLQKRIRRAAEANLRIERKLAQRPRPTEDCQGTHFPIAQESFARLALEGEPASKSADVAVPESAAAFAQGKLPAIQPDQSHLLP